MKKVFLSILSVLLVCSMMLSLTGCGIGYKSAIDNLIDYTFEGKSSAIKKLAPKAYWDYMEDEHDQSLEDAIDEYEEQYELAQEMLEEQYGEKFKVKYKVTDKDKIKKADLKDIAEALEDKYEIKASSVKAGYEIEIEVTIKGKEDEEEEESELTVLKIGGKWYPVSVSEYDDEVYVNFMV